MDLQKTLRVIKTFNTLIEKRITGNPVQFAKELCISERSLYRLINSYKLQGIEIKFSRRKKTYYIAKNKKEITSIESAIEAYAEVQIRT